MPWPSPPEARGLTVEAVDPGAPEAKALMHALSGALEAITGDDGRSRFDPDDLRPPAGVFLIARDGKGDAVGCGGMRDRDDGDVEIKRMFACPGSGAGLVILHELERRAWGAGARRMVLSTRWINRRATAFYEKHGFRECAPYGDYVERPQSVCMQKKPAPSD